MRLKELREERNFTQNDVATAIKTTRTNIGRWEKGENEPSANFVIQLADFFEVSTDYLLGREDDFGNISVKTETAPALPKESQELLDIFDSLDKFHQVQVLEYARYFSMRENATKNKKG